ncbi:class I SAM-dependent methyltransferase [Ignatzschineria rhizosphaerae]|uniref:Class I SAM-dependent methyltransferase n=1 Tax=Ignatzschineria rhizosphaerae TaxID=2923279 RepID=A0ABY3X6U9_9GAMM|nr:class I SAM-dependent methyltransferase [Ignatzschineria rhizosphaerae]UNM97187.1 class I SAM-dependent methyltransferase [Ignatzschineria rhizosphaerae]
MKSHWNERFLRKEYLYGEAANQFIQELEPVLQPEGSLLAIAEGEGRNALFLAKKAKEANRVLSIDLWDYSDVALQKVNARKGDLTIKTREVDLTTVTWGEDQYDYACCVYGHFDQVMQREVFQGLRQAVKNGGWIFGEVYSKEQVTYGTGGPRDIEYLYSPSMFLDIFATDFFKHLYVGEVTRSEGELHQGLCHVIQFAIEVRK